MRTHIVATWVVAAAACLGAGGPTTAVTTTTATTTTTTVTATRPAVSGDRGGDPEVTFPDSFLRQNGGPVIDVTRPPEPWMRPAKGDGVADDTAALRDAFDLLKREFVAHGPWDRADYYVYLPRGAYRVTDTVVYRGESMGRKKGDRGGFDLNHIRFVGQNRAATVIRLDDACPGFGDVKAPKPVLAFQHPDTAFDNVPGANWLRNLTVDAGRGNAGAVGVDFQGANQTDINHVTVRAGDGSGRYGIRFRLGSIQGYYADVTVDGFDVGLFDPVNAEGDVSFEYLTTTRQRTAGIVHGGGGMSLRRWRSDQAAVPALRLDGTGSQTVVLDSDLHGTGPAAVEATRDAGQCLFARDVRTDGYGAEVARGQDVLVPAGAVGEYTSMPATTLFPGRPARSLDLPIEEVPATPWYPPSQWAVVDDYPTVQAAMDAGKPAVVFRQHAYDLPGDVRVPAGVRSVMLMGATLRKGRLVVAEPAAEPLTVADGHAAVRVTARRDVDERCIGGGSLSNPTGLPVTFFLENVNDVASHDDFCRPGQRVFARQVDIEYANTEQTVVGGTMWVFGYKTENGTAEPFAVRPGGTLEVLGGYTNATVMAKGDKLRPVIRNDGGTVSATLFTNMNGPWDLAITETRDGVTKQATRADLPARGGEYRSNYFVPLYVGGR